MAKNVKKDGAIEEVTEEVKVEGAVIEEVKDELPPHVDVKPDKVEKKKSLGTVFGVVVNCNLLRLREGANIKTKEIAQIPVSTKVLVNLDNSTESFYEVTYADGAIQLIGFCVKDFIEVG